MEYAAAIGHIAFQLVPVAIDPAFRQIITKPTHTQNQPFTTQRAWDWFGILFQKQCGCLFRKRICIPFFFPTAAGREQQRQCQNQRKKSFHSSFLPKLIHP